MENGSADDLGEEDNGRDGHKGWLTKKGEK